MHLKIDELLALRDGEGSPASEEHLVTCDVCRSELDHLVLVAEALGELEELRPEPGGWQRLQQAQLRLRSRQAWWWVAAAASVVVAALVTVWVVTTPRNGAPQAAAVPGLEDAQQELITVSQELELLLDSPSVRYSVLTPEQTALIVNLEDRIAMVDEQLVSTSSQHTLPEVALWLERVELLETLVAAHEQQPEQLGFVRTSLGEERK